MSRRPEAGIGNPGNAGSIESDPIDSLFGVSLNSNTLGRNRNHLENAVIATFFFALAVVFIWLLFKGYSTQEIMARGWGIQVRIYRRSSEPIMYWATFWMYLVIAVICVVVGILLTLKIVATHAT